LGDKLVFITFSVSLPRLQPSELLKEIIQPACEAGSLDAFLELISNYAALKLCQESKKSFVCISEECREFQITNYHLPGILSVIVGLER